MKFYPDLNHYLPSFSQNVINGQIPSPVEITEISDKDIDWKPKTEEGHYRVLVNQKYLNRLGLRRNIVKVYPYHPKKGYDFKNHTTFSLEGTKTKFFTFHQDPYTGKPEVNECIAAPSSWFEDEKIPYYSGTIQAILWSILLPPLPI